MQIAGRNGMGAGGGPRQPRPRVEALSLSYVPCTSQGGASVADPDELDVSARGLLVSVFENARSSLVARVGGGAADRRSPGGCPCRCPPCPPSPSPSAEASAAYVVSRR